MKENKRITSSIKFKLISMFMLMIIMPLTISGIMSYNKSSKLLKQSLQESASELVKQTNTSISYYTTAYEESILQVSKDPNVQQILTNPSYSTWMLNSFKGFIESHEGVETIYIGTQDKKVNMYPEKELPSDYDPTSRDWYKKAFEQKKVVWTDPYIDISSKKLTISVAAPVYNSFNKSEFIGVVGLDLDLSDLAARINSIKMGKNGYVSILAENKNILTNKDNLLIGKPLSIPEVVKSLNEKSEGYVEYKVKENGIDKNKFALYTKVPKLNWTILVTMYEDEIGDKTKVMLSNTIVVGLILLAISILISLIFSKSITNPINMLLNNINKIKEGDFTIRCIDKSKDEIGELSRGINSMVESVGGLINNIQLVSNELNSSSETLAATSLETSSSVESVTDAVEEISKGAVEQAGDSEKASVLALELSNKLKDLGDNTNLVLKSTEEVITINQKGVEAVDGLQSTNKLNKSSIENIEIAVLELDSKSKNISSILETISSIAEQTNLLALNASIEAARAGEAGKGFAVVADEIRKLAEGSNNAVKEINEIVTSIQKESSNTVNIMKEVRDISDQQSSSVDEVNSSFEYIFSSIKSITENIKSVGEFVNQINKDKESIIEAIHNISSVSEETAAASEEVTASMQQQSAAIHEVSNSAEKLNEQAIKLNTEISKFKI